jgi:hypothetical protein
MVFILSRLKPYMIPNRCRMIRMTAITIRVWIQPPVCGMDEWMFEPKKPTSQRMISITMIVHNIMISLERLWMAV